MIATPLWVTCGGSGTTWPLAQSPSDVSLVLGALAVQATFELSASVHSKTLRNAMRRIDGRARRSHRLPMIRASFT